MSRHLEKPIYLCTILWTMGGLEYNGQMIAPPFTEDQWGLDMFEEVRAIHRDLVGGWHPWAVCKAEVRIW